MKIRRKRLTETTPSVAPKNTNAQPPDTFIAELVELRRALHQRALFLAQDRTAAEDLLQETLERALQSRDRFREGSNLGAWVFSIMRNLFIDGRRRRAIRARLEQKAFWLGELEPLTRDPERDDEAPRYAECGRIDVGASDPGALTPLDVITSDDVEAAVAMLAPAQQEIFMLAYGVRRLSYREIAIKLGIPASTTGTRLLRVRAKVRRRLEHVYEARCRQRVENI
jgi:RNA polymerase sigma-70 factor (ECF subfamily)